MSYWRNLKRALTGLRWPRTFRKGSCAAEARLCKAYRRVFLETGEDGEIVLADLAEFTGFYKFTPPGDLEGLQFANGKRAVFARKQQYLRMSDADFRRLEEAALHEAQQHLEDEI